MNIRWVALVGVLFAAALFLMDTMQIVQAALVAPPLDALAFDNYNNTTLSQRRLRVIPGTGIFTDGESTFLFHGINLVAKGHEALRVNPKMIDFLLRHGYNSIRLGFLWYNAEPSPGVYNTTYLDLIRDDINMLWENGIRVILDLHQDCYSSYYCGAYDTFPDFIAHAPNTTEFQRGGKSAFPLPMVAPKYDQGADLGDPWGRINNCNELRTKGTFKWASCYATFAMGKSTQRLYDNEDGLLDHFASFWAYIVGYYKGHPGIVGYELINEPWLGDVPLRLKDMNGITNPKHWNLWIEGVSDRKNLQHMYDVLQDAIRDVDPEAVIFFEPATGGNLLDMFPVGFESGPGGHDFDAAGLNVLSYHTYCPWLERDMSGNQTIGNEIKHWFEKNIAKLCVPMNTLQYSIRQNDMKRLHVGGWLTEFGEVPQDPRSYAFLEFTLSKMDEYLESWTYWCDLYATDEVCNDIAHRALVRPYPMMTWGMPKSLQYNNSTKVMTYEFVTPEQVTIANRTSIFLPPMETSGVAHWSVDVHPYNLFNGIFDAPSNMYYLEPINMEATLQTTVSVTVLQALIPPSHEIA